MKLTKILSVILSVLMVLSTVSIAAYAAETEDIAEENIISEIEEQISDEIDETLPKETEKLSYIECLEGFSALCLKLIADGAAVPLTIAVVSVAFTPAIVTLPLTLPISAIARVAVSFAGIIGMLFSPVGAGVIYFNQ